MQKTTIKSCKKIISCVLLFLAFFSDKNTSAQSPAEFSVSASPGFTIVNFKEALGFSDDFMIDWNQFHISVNGKMFLPSKGTFQIGAEVSWNKLYYAYYRYPYTQNQYFYYEYDVSTTSVMIMGRSSMKSFFMTGSAGIHIFKSGIAAAIGCEMGFNAKITENLYFPIAFRVTPIFDDGMPIPVSLGLGLAYRF